jgi:enterochelin esterase-like enzyme
MGAWVSFFVLACLSGRSQHVVHFLLQAPEGRQATRDSFFLASDHNGWRPNDPRWLFAPVQGGYELTVHIDPPDRMEYKVTRGGWDRAEAAADGFPAENRGLVIHKDTTVVVRVTGWTDRTPRQHTASPRVSIAADSFPSRTLGNRRRIWAWLPPSYDQSTHKKYPVIYLQDGQNLFDRANTAFGTEWRVDETMDSLTHAGLMECIIIGIESGGSRMAEYLPYPSARFPEAHGKEYAKFMAEELVPWVDAHYRTMPDAGDRVIAGSSMGGLISLYTALAYPAVFGGVGAFSTSYWIAPDIYRKAEEEVNALSGLYYLYAGEAESPELVGETKKMAAILRKNPLLRVREQYQPGGKHQELFWQGPFRDMMVAILKK